MQVGHHNTQTNNYYDGRARAAAVVEQVAAADAVTPVVFVGRDRQVTELLRLLDPAGSGVATTVVSVVAGLAGVGKTALALHAAQVAVSRGWFPGGAVFVDLYGYDADPEGRVRPGQVFAPLLRALGVTGAEIPPVIDEQAAVYHRELASLAEQGQSVLLVLDNASTVGQLAGLLPRHGIHRALVTSRHTLSVDGARGLDLDVLDEPDAVALLDQTLRECHPGDLRVVEQGDGAKTLAGLCGRLPLALQITAGLLAESPSRPLSRLVGELSDAATRLDGLTYAERAVRAVFDLSWHHLAEHDRHAARLFRLLPVNPGPDLSTDAAAALADEPPQRVVRHLRVLRWAHLIRADPAGERWRMHDLIRLYAIGLPHVDPDECIAATTRLLHYYLTTTVAADDHLRALPEQPVPDRFTGREAALEWLDAERANLVPAVDLAATTGQHDTTLRLAIALAEFLNWRRHLDDRTATATTALDAAQHLADRHREGLAWNNLGLALRMVRRFDEGITAHQRAADIYRKTSDRHGEGKALTNLGAALWEVQRFDEAITALQQAAGIFAETSDHREGQALNNLGLALREVRRFNEAITAHQRAADIHRETGNRQGEGKALNNLGLALREVGRFDEAITAHEQDLAICRETGDHHGEGMAVTNLGTALQEVGRFNEAITAHEQAAAIFRETSDRHGEGTVLNNLGTALQEVGRFNEAITAHEQAAEAYTEVGATQDAADARNLAEQIRATFAQPQGLTSANDPDADEGSPPRG